MNLALAGTDIVRAKVDLDRLRCVTRRALTVFSLTCMLVAAEPARAQTVAPDPAPPASTAAATIPVPPPEVLLLLIRSTLIALHHANMTGNYTVLRDIGAPSFQAQNTAARLTEVFANLRVQGTDLLPVSIETPQLSEGPLITPQGLLMLAGSFSSRQTPVRFQLQFQPVAGQWRLFGIGVQPAPPQLAQGTAEPAKPSDAKTRPPPPPPPAAKPKS